MSDELEPEGEAEQPHELKVYGWEANIIALCHRIIETVEARSYFLSRFPQQRRCEDMTSVALAAQWIGVYALHCAEASHLPASVWEQDQAQEEAEAGASVVVYHPVPDEPPTGGELN